MASSDHTVGFEPADRLAQDRESVRRRFWIKFKQVVAQLPFAEDLLAAYYRRLKNPDPAVHLPAARAWSTYEGACSTLLPSPETVAHFAGDGRASCRERV